MIPVKYIKYIFYLLKSRNLYETIELRFYTRKRLNEKHFILKNSAKENVSNDFPYKMIGTNLFFLNNFKNKFKKLLYLSELWQEVHAGRTPGRKEVNEHRLATGDDVRKIPGGQGA